MRPWRRTHALADALKQHERHDQQKMGPITGEIKSFSLFFLYLKCRRRRSIPIGDIFL